MTLRSNCKRFEERLTAYALGDLPADQAQAVREHLEDCERCRASLQELRPTLDLLQDALAADALPVARLEPERKVRIRAARERTPLIAFITSARFLANAAAVLVLCGVLGALLVPAFQNTMLREDLGSPVAMAPAANEPVASEAWSWDRTDVPADAEVLRLYNQDGAMKVADADIDQSAAWYEREELARGAASAPARDFAWGVSGGDGPAPAGESFGLPARGKTTETETARLAGSYFINGRGGAVELNREEVGEYRQDKLQEKVQVLGDVPLLGALLEEQNGDPASGVDAKQDAEDFASAVQTGPVSGYVAAPSRRAPSAPSVERKPAERRRMDLALDAREESSDQLDLAFRDRARELSDLEEVAGRERKFPAQGDMPVLSGEFALADVANGTTDRLEISIKGVKDEPAASSVFRAWGVNPFVDARENPLSTFSIDVDTASYTLARKYLRAGLLPPAEAVRTEEFINFFDYGYRAPEGGTFAIHAEYAPAPFGEGWLLKIGVKGRRLGREEQRRAALTFVIDTSGSMGTPDRLGLIQESLRLLVGQLDPRDTVAIVQYGSQARLALGPTPAAERERILETVAALQSAGSTHLEEGLRLGYETAARVFDGGAVNRVLLLSDGMANLGSADAEQILSGVEAYRRQGIYCSVFGFGRGTYNDEMLETLADKGDGTYRFIDTIGEAQRVFVDDLAATLNVIARDVKIQVEFDPAQVRSYRQLGYENRQLRAEDFRNDAVDAGEVGSGQSVTALYELLPAGDARSTLGTVRVRYRDVVTGEVEEVERRVDAMDRVRDFADAPPHFKLAAGVAEFAEILRGSPFAEGGSFEDVAAVLRPVALELSLDERVAELLRLVQAAPGLPRATE